MSNVTAPIVSVVLIAKPGGELQEALDVGEIASQSERHADRAGALAAAMLNDLRGSAAA